MTNIILIRHGESETNLTKSFTGQLDVPLTERGKMQAEAVAEYLDQFKIDIIYASPLSRAYETAEAIARRKDCKLKIKDAFCEINAGLWQGLTFDEISERYPDTYKLWKEDIARAIPDGGESCLRLFQRVTDEFRRIIEKRDKKTICIVTHATPIRMMESYMIAGTLEKAKDISWVPNASASFYCYDGDFVTIKRGNCDYLGNMITNLPNNI